MMAVVSVVGVVVVVVVVVGGWVGGDGDGRCGGRGVGWRAAGDGDYGMEGAPSSGNACRRATSYDLDLDLLSLPDQLVSPLARISFFQAGSSSRSPRGGSPGQAAPSSRRFANRRTPRFFASPAQTTSSPRRNRLDD